MAEKVGGIFYESAIETKGLIEGERQAKKSLAAIGAEGDRLGARMDKMAAAIKAALAAIAVEQLVSKLVATQRQFDVMFASLKTMTGGVEAAGREFDRLREFAAKTPFTLEQSVKGFVKLKALGLDPSERAMTSFGNTASAMGKNLDQMIEAVADASTGEFERLKEFGIRAKQEGDKVSLTFQGVTTTIRNDAASITEYLTKLGEVNFAGAMSERMKTLDGDISNLQDSVSGLFLAMSKAGAGEAIARGVRLATEAIQQLELSVREGALTEYFDKLRPFITAAEVGIVTLAGAIAGKLVQAFITMAMQAYAAAAATGAATLAARGFLGVIQALGGPIGIAITGLALLALNWEKVGGQARDAATMSEQAAERIKAALQRSPGRAATDLAAQLKDVRDELSLIDQELGRDPKRGGAADPSQLQELRSRRATLMAIAGDIQRAMDGLHGGQGRGKIIPALVGGTPAPTPAPPPKSKFDTEGYLAGLRARTMDGMALLDAEEEEAKRQLERRAREEPALAARKEEALLFIAIDFAKKRQDLKKRETDELAALDIERMRRAEDRERDQSDEAERRMKSEAEARARGQALAIQTIAASDPIAALQFELEQKSALLREAAARDMKNLSLYAQAQVALEQDTQARIAAIVRGRQDQRYAEQAALLQSYGNLFGGVADLTKTFAGEQSGAYKAMFVAQKTFAIASAILGITTGAAKAWELGWPAGMVAAGQVLAQGATLISTIKGANYGGGRQYGGPVDAGSLYRVNEGGRPEMFTAASGAQYMMPTTSGRVTPADQVGGATQLLVQVINSHPTASVDVQQGDDGRVVRIAVSEVANQISEHRGPVWAAMRGQTNVRAAL